MLQRISSAKRSLVIAAAVAATLAGTMFPGGHVAADDRDLLRESSSDPYVFILFDTSGSMHWTPQCTQAQFDAGVCDFLCPTGDCFAPMNGDDSVSKFAQAKEALYEVLGQVDGINFGFATYNQDDLRLRAKHWLYKVSDAKPNGSANFLTLRNGDHFPDIALHCSNTGAACNNDADCAPRGGTCDYPDVFGATWPCDEGTNDRERGCWGSSAKISDMNDLWELNRVQRLPKLGAGPDFSGIPTGQLRDRFDTDSFSNNDGSIFWSGSWIENDHSGGSGPTAGNARIENGRLRLDDTPDVSGGRPSLARQANLSSFSTGAELAFDFEIVGDVENEDEVVIEISSNGGSNWTTLERFRNFSNPASGSRTYDITGHTSSTTRIRFRLVNQYRGSDEQFRVDNLEIRPLVEETVVYLRNNNDSRRYKLIYRPVANLSDGSPNRYGNAQLAVQIEVRECTNNNDNCSSSFVDRQTIYYDLVDEFASWDNGSRRGPSRMAFYSQGSAGDVEASNTCDGWDDNDDTGDDRYPTSTGYNLRWPNDPDPPPPRFDFDGDGTLEVPDFLVGDMIPLDWENNRKAQIMERLAPNTVGNSLAIPDFGVANYLRDARSSSENFLRLKSEFQRPLVADGATPLGTSIRDFRVWYNGCAQGNCPNSTGWSDTAAIFDRDFNCRKKFLMVLTDGDNTCNGPSACSGTASLRAQTGIKTFVVAFGVQGGGNTLTCMAANGGTGDPIYPQNKQELVDALLQLFGDIKVEARAFASASVPTVQNQTSDKIFLSSFTPLPKKAVWPGRLNAFRKPLPLKDDNTPDFDRDCRSLNLQSGCHLWDAAEILRTDQAPTAADVASGDYRIGNLESQRRVIYSKENLGRKVPADLRLFLPPAASSADEVDLFSGLGLNVVSGNTASEAAARAETVRIIGETVQIQEVTVPDPNGGPDLEFMYVMGDIFHADPRVLSSPNHLIYFRQDLNGYQDFSKKHFWRRKMLTVGANDGQLHFFDAGVRTVVRDPTLGVDLERFTDGTGKELLSYIPRLVLPVVRDQAGGENHIYSLDGAQVSADVYIDPLFDPDNADLANANHREWRTVLVAGLREGGDVFRASLPVRGFVSGYFALDVTQPDQLVTPAVTATNPDPKPIPKPAGASGSPPIVPSCISLSGDDLGGAAGCETANGEPYPFPAELWSFTDSVEVDVDSDGRRETFYFDEEINGQRDLGDTWSKPVIGQIRVCGGLVCDPTVQPNDLEERFVAIFGGGIEPKNPNSSERGAWLYMVDVESGRAIYKRRLDGSAPTAPAVLDSDRDGIFDVVYIATTAGLVYKVDLTAVTTSGALPGLSLVTIPQSRLLAADPSKGLPAGVAVERVMSSVWEPFAIFDTEGKPIYMTPTAFLVPELEQFALAFGTGNRHNLWQFNGLEGRFYTIVDENYSPANAAILPRRETDYQRVQLTDGNTTASFLADRPASQRGWYFGLAADEKVITQAFVLVGVLIFTSFDPAEAVDLDNDGFIDACARTGVSRAFVVDAENGNAFVDLDNGTGGLDRFHQEGDFTTAPYVDSTTTKNPDSSGKTTESDLNATQEALQEAIRQALMRFFPKGCRYNKSFSLTVNASRSDTGHVRYATIPIAMCPVDWKEE